MLILNNAFLVLLKKCENVVNSWHLFVLRFHTKRHCLFQGILLFLERQSKSIRLLWEGFFPFFQLDGPWYYSQLGLFSACILAQAEQITAKLEGFFVIEFYGIIEFLYLYHYLNLSRHISKTKDCSLVQNAALVIKIKVLKGCWS